MENTMSNPNPPVTDSAARHAARIRERDAQRAKTDDKPRDTRQTYEVYAERALAGARADQALRDEARRNDARARGEWLPSDGPDDDSESEAEETAEFDPKDSPERRAAKVAWRSTAFGGYVAI
jgi:hypothetical protein